MRLCSKDPREISREHLRGNNACFGGPNDEERIVRFAKQEKTLTRSPVSVQQWCNISFGDEITLKRFNRNLPATACVRFVRIRVIF